MLRTFVEKQAIMGIFTCLSDDQLIVHVQDYPFGMQLTAQKNR
jgi:hypothetical protein